MSRISEDNRRGRAFRTKVLLNPGRKTRYILGNASCYTWLEGRVVTSVLEQGGKEGEAGVN